MDMLRNVGVERNSIGPKDRGSETPDRNLEGQDRSSSSVIGLL